MADLTHRSNASQSSAHRVPPPSINDRGPGNLSSSLVDLGYSIGLGPDAVLLQCRSPLEHFPRRAMSTKPHVGIIGAGLSGLRCADILLQNGARVTILEARDRIGGRVGFSPAIRDISAFWVVSVMANHG